MRRKTWWLAVALGLAWVGAASAIEGDPEAARPLNERAREAYAAGNFVEAAQFFEQSYQAYQHPEFIYNQAQCLRRASQNEAALTAYQRYVEAGGGAAVAHIQIGECLTALGRRDEARQAFERYLELEPEGPHAAQARQAIDSGQPPSEQDHRRPEEVRDAQTYYDRALEAYNSSGDADAFIRAMREGHERYNMPEFLLNAAGACQFELRHEDEAALRRQYAETPGAPADAWYQAGNACLLANDHDGALQAYQRYLRLEPQGEHAADAGEMIHRLESPTQPHSMEQIEQAREAVRRGQEHYDAGRVQEALREFEQAHQLAADRQTYFNICMCYTSLRQWPEATRHWETYLRSGELGHDAVGHLFAAQAYAGAGSRTEARRHIDRYIELADQNELPNEEADTRWAQGMRGDTERGSSGGQ